MDDATKFWNTVERLLDGRTWKWLSDSTGWTYDFLMAARKREPRMSEVATIAGALRMPVHKLVLEVGRA